MFGWGGSFPYQECVDCASIWIEEIPADVARYYPTDYYSFNASGTPSVVKQWVKKQVSLYRLGLGGWTGKLLGRVFPDPMIIAWLKLVQPRLDMAVQDVGCGSGTYLNDMAGIGFTNLMGVDPYVAADLQTPRGVPVRKMAVEDVSDTFDLVMSHHVFEHIADPEAHLGALVSRLNPGGRLLMRVPVAASQAWKQYGTDWFQLDAPRHLHVPSVRGFEQMAVRAGLELEKIVFDSDERQFRFSALYARGLSLQQITQNNTGSFSEAEMAEFVRLSDLCNRNQTGDSAGFVLKVRG
jgi:SAM-dependent methyltransferase